jgi:hypothetical protein
MVSFQTQANKGERLKKKKKKKKERGVFCKEVAFVNYLKYLMYWKRPEYAKFLANPICLTFLTMLQEETFRNSLGDPKLIDNIYFKQSNFILHYDANRQREAMFLQQQMQLEQEEKLRQAENNVMGDGSDGVSAVSVNGNGDAPHQIVHSPPRKRHHPEGVE